MRTVFIFGAGVSRQAGAPLMSDFLDRAEQLYMQGAFKNTKAQHAWEKLESVLHALQSVHYKSYFDSDNIESIFGAIELGKVIGGFGEFSQGELSELSEYTKEVIAMTIDKSIKYHFDPYITPPQPFGLLYNTLRRMSEVRYQDICKLTFITFNYDTALETALHATGYSDIIKTDNESLPTLLKLHGSINWGHCASCGKITSTDFTRQTYSKGDFFLNARSAVDKVTCCDKQTQLLIVPPTWNKTSYHSILTKIWQRAAQELKQAENIYIAGYSLPETDAFFRYLFALGTVGKTRIKKFWVFNPDATGDVEERFRKLTGRGIENRFKYFQVDFAQSLKIIGQELQTTYSF